MPPSKRAGTGRDIRIGCSGWQYRSWRGRFYPEKLPVRLWFAHYSSVFDTVEVNNTFYRLPASPTFVQWREASPPRFEFALKASRFLTHMKRLIEPIQPIGLLYSRAVNLGPALGPVLYQLPATFRRDIRRLKAFLAALPRSPGDIPVVDPSNPQPPQRNAALLRHVVEFRHASWYTDEVFALLEQYDVAICLHDKREGAYQGDAVGPFSYVRFHGPSGQYHGSYSTADLEKWADRLIRWKQRGRRVYVYFNNDADAMAARNALTLCRLVS